MGRETAMYGIDDPDIVARVRAYVKLLRARRSVLARVEGLLAQHGLTPTQLGVLEALLHKGPLTHRELSHKVLTSAGNMTDVIDKLARRGLVLRTASAIDRRQVVITLTASGDTLIRAVFPAHAADIALAMGNLDEAETAELARLLRKLGRGAPDTHALGAGDLAPATPATHLAGQSFDVE